MPPPASDPNPSATDLSSPQAEHATGEIRGDRMCLKCGFNLHGQTILREPHYGLLIVRCPECSGVTSLQEYPVLGPWARRWGYLFAAVYILFITGLFGLTAFLIGVSSVGLVQDRMHTIANEIATAHRPWFDAVGKAQAEASAKTPAEKSLVSSTVSSVQSWGSYAAINREWWEREGAAARAAIAARKPNLPVEQLLAYTFIPVCGLAVGGFFAVLLPGLRGPRLLMIPLVTVSLGLLFCYFFSLTTRTAALTNFWLPGFVPSGELAAELLPSFAFYRLALVMGAILAVGVYLGRPVARFLIRTFLTPRLAHSLSFLWESYPAPRTR